MAKKQDKKNSTGPVAANKKAYHNFELVERFEAGLSLMGSEVKSLRTNGADLSGSYARIIDEQVWLVGANITQYDQAGMYNHEPSRNRKLLLHRREIGKIRTKLEQRGFTLVPLKIYFNARGFAKIELALARGKKQYDKRSTIAAREQKRSLDRQMKNYR